MARPGVTYEVVENAVTAIEERGGTVTYLSVRDEIGSGSLSTIGGHLKIVRERRIANPSVTVDIPSEIAAEFGKLVQQAWLKAQCTAAQDVDAIRNIANQRVETIEHELQTIMVRFDETTDQLAHQADALIQAQGQVKSLEQALASVEGERAALEMQVDTLTSAMEAQAANFDRWMSRTDSGRRGRSTAQKGKDANEG